MDKCVFKSSLLPMAPSMLWITVNESECYSHASQSTNKSRNPPLERTSISMNRMAPSEKAVIGTLHTNCVHLVKRMDILLHSHSITCSLGLFGDMNNPY